MVDIRNLQHSSACSDCGFDVYNRITELSASTLALYSDSRFPGRCIVSFNTHYDHLEDMTSEHLEAFMDDVTAATKAIKHVTGSGRVNFAVLGNAVSHVHAHLVPRYPEQEELPHKSPWDDPRPHSNLDTDVAQGYMRQLADRILSVQS